jgi:hypothetical protein
MAEYKEPGSATQSIKAITSLHHPEFHSSCHAQALYLARDLLIRFINSHPNQTEPYAFHA